MKRSARHSIWLFAALLCGLVPPPPAAFAEESSDKVEEYIQELFLGESAYSQDVGELQFTLGYFWNDRGDYGSSLPVLFEYGITDTFQVGVVLPINFFRTDDPESQDGLGNVEFEAYWGFINNPDTGVAGGIGFGYSLPEATSGADEDAHIFEPFAVIYKDFGPDAVNVSGSIEVERPRDPDDDTETSGDVAFAHIRPDRRRPIVWLLEVGTEIEADDTQVRLAPGAYYRPDGGIWELGFSVPVGLTEDSPSVGAFAMLTFEFE